MSFPVPGVGMKISLARHRFLVSSGGRSPADLSGKKWVVGEICPSIWPDFPENAPGS